MSTTKRLNQDSSKGLEYKNLIKEKILKPSKSSEYQFLKKHHSHLVIRDSNYFNKNPTCFIACASCHRGRVLKITYLQEQNAIDILNEIYSIIGANPCSKKRAKQNISNNGNNNNNNHISLNNNDNNHNNNHLDSNNKLASVLNGPMNPVIPKFEDFFNDIDDLDLSNHNLNFKLPIHSINSFTSVSNSSLISIQKGDTNFPTSLDLFQSLIIDKYYPNSHTKNTLLIHLPTLSNTKFSTSLDEQIYLQDISLQEGINQQISKFIESDNFTGLNNLKIMVIICSYQEGLPANPQEDQTHKYVGKLILYSDFINNELMNNQLMYQTKKFFLNHDYTYIDSKFEWFQSQFLQKILIQPFQQKLLNKYKYPIMGESISQDVYLNTSMSINVPYIINSSYYQINFSTSLYIVVFLMTKIIRKFVALQDNLNEVNIMNCLQGIEYNNQFNISMLKLVLDNLSNLYQK